MSLLGWLTLAYVAVLVLALVASLTAIALQLRRTGALLAETRDALGRVQRRTAGLEGPLTALEDATGELSEELREAAARLDTALRRPGDAGADGRRKAG